LPREEHEGQGVRCVRDYTCCVKDEERGAPTVSTDGQDDADVTMKFLQSSRRIWQEAWKWFPRHHHERVLRDLTQYQRKGGPKRLCGPWTRCSVNVAVENQTVQAQPAGM
jgi:hypothetical protein